MKSILLLILSAVICLHSCKKNNDIVPSEKDMTNKVITNATTDEEDLQVLKVIWEEIGRVSQSVQCNNISEWKIVPISPKPCGGYYSAIPYHSSIDENLFLKNVEHYNEQVSKYHQKKQIVSDCSVEPYPKKVKCENNKAVVY